MVGESVRSYWWVVIAFVPVISGIGLGLAVFRWQSAGWVDPFIVPYVYLFVFALFAHPIAIYLDVKGLETVGSNWEPDPVVYVSGAVLGIMVPLISPIVALIYLGNRVRKTDGSSPGT